MKSAALALTAVLGLTACAEGAQDEKSPHDASACERDAAGQAACLSAHFKVAACGDARVLGSAFRTELIGYNHWTAFAVSKDCLTGLRQRAESDGFVRAADGELVATGGAGYTQKLLMSDAKKDQEGGVIWERIQE